MQHLLWHYIQGPRFQFVVDSGVILPDAHVVEGQSACIWFARDHMWEKKVGQISTDHPTEKFYRLNRDETAKREHGLWRIGVLAEVAPYDWRSYGQLIGKGRFEPVLPSESAMKSGNPGELLGCRISVQSVPNKHWESLQVWQDGTWVDIPFEELEP